MGIYLVILIIVPLYGVGVVIKYIIMDDQYQVFLEQSLEYDTVILNVVKELRTAGYYKEALAIGLTAISTQDINRWWHMNIFNWSNDQFLYDNPKLKRHFNYWLQTGKLLFPDQETQQKTEGQFV